MTNHSLRVGRAPWGSAAFVPLSPPCHPLPARWEPAEQTPRAGPWGSEVLEPVRAARRWPSVPGSGGGGAGSQDVRTETLHTVFHLEEMSELNQWSL